MHTERNSLNPLKYLTADPTRIRVSGNSMMPFLEEGDEVEVVAAERKDFSPGDLIVFDRHGDLIVHRVIKAGKDRFLEMGDNQRNGSWWEWQDHLGKVVSLVSAGGALIPVGEGASASAGRKTARLQRFRLLRSALERKARFQGLKKIVGLPFRFLEFMMTKKCWL
ncbi:MAG TPA: S24/S26 family peptidase [Acidobacteriota bacterium]|nr:S24/S26 family peptidase [Acidobacteriota bacterium]HNT18035.1 S24/S26 family peptidase [Acidobacteriota bacterium]HPA27752.1 S24/S26 family peptidase [Acidobacteriota bacterium]HQO18943.1 S24/S26 family peptidase [Acidobacteriota bacterium]HQQ46397.1 S24/S26 family peptidase [Acidobacteriota bacterium]